MKNQFILFWDENVKFINPTKYGNNPENVLDKLKFRLTRYETELLETIPVFVVDPITKRCHVLEMYSDGPATTFFSMQFLPNSKEVKNYIGKIAKIIKAYEKDTLDGAEKVFETMPDTDMTDNIIKIVTGKKPAKNAWERFRDPERAKAFASNFILRTADEIAEIKEAPGDSHIFGTDEEGWYYVLTEKEVIDQLGEEFLNDGGLGYDAGWYFLEA